MTTDAETEDWETLVEEIQTGICLAWAGYREEFPKETDLVILTNGRRVDDSNILWEVRVMTRAVATSIPGGPKVIREALARPAGESPPSMPVEKAAWVIVDLNGHIMGCLRIAQPCNASGGSA